MEKAGSRSKQDEKHIRQVIDYALVSFQEEDHTFPVGHNFYLHLLKNTTDIYINQNSQEISGENPQDNATAFPPGYLYPMVRLENVSVSANIYCCSSLVSSRNCSRGFELVYGDKTSPMPVTAAVSETSPSTNTTTNAPTDMTTMLTSSPASMTSPQTGGIPAPESNDGLVVKVVVGFFAVLVLVAIGCIVGALLYLCWRDRNNRQPDPIHYNHAAEALLGNDGIIAVGATAPMRSVVATNALLETE
ncbi:hypothetical protein BV898_00757 [Hypsibius exemplaris]|uniref:Uncharacterized protein n=1 Tax=Hypsibius exemplaris TaxID=2072580 RepID=A0A1W0XEP1_HYPEX|nr:hypothetical protein BV898_00757 [Hypsibius exemplaris]